MTQPSAPDTGHARALDQLRSVLIPGEELQAHAVQRRLFALLHRRVIVGATTGRFIVLTRGFIAGFTPTDLRWQDLRDAHLQVGILGATLTVSADVGQDLAGAAAGTRTIALAGLRKDEAREVYRFCQAQTQAWREKRRVRELEELRAKSGGIQLGGGMGTAFGGGAAATPGNGEQSPAARLERAKEMLAKGLLTDAEYEQIKARIVSDL